MTNTNESVTPTPGSGQLDHAVNSISDLLSDDFTIEAEKQNDKKNKGSDKRSHENVTDHQDHMDDDEEGDDHSDEEDNTKDENDDSDREEPDAEHIDDSTQVEVKIDGNPTAVTFKELRDGYLRHADYTRKTMAVAEERKAVQAERSETQEERSRLKNGLEQVAYLFQQLTPQEPTPAQWDALYAQDPQEWLRQREYWRSWKDQQIAVAQQYAEHHQRQQMESQRDLHARYAEEANKLKDAIPEWEDPEKAKSEKEAVREFAYSMGYTKEDVDNTVDHRIFVIARKAMLYDQLMQRKRELKPVAPTQSTKIIRPGNQTTKPTRRAGVTEAKQRLAKSGNVRDAAFLLEKLF